MVKYKVELRPEDIKHIIATIKKLRVNTSSDFESYLIDDTLTWHIEAGDIVDPVEVRSAVRRYMSMRQSNNRNEDPPPVEAGGDQTNARSDLDIWKDVFGEV